MNGFLRPRVRRRHFDSMIYITSLDKMIALKPAKIGYAHFGCYDEAVARLQAVKAQTILWYEIAQAGAKEGKTAEEIIELIGKKDKTIDKLNALDKSIFQRDRTLELIGKKDKTIDKLNALDKSIIQRDRILIMNTVRGLMTAK